MIVYFVRHGSAGESKSNPTQDLRRPLDKEGVEQVSQIGRVLAALPVQADAIISSPLKRATQTASLIANELGHEAKVLFSQALSKEAEFDQFRALLQKRGRDDSILVVGHNPNLSRFLSLLLTGGTSAKAMELKKGAVACLEIDSRGRATLRWLVSPKIVRAVHETFETSSRPKTSRK